MANQNEIDPRILSDEKERLSELVYIPRDLADSDHGVLLSDKIEHFCSGQFKLIDPFEKEYLRPAGYDLRVGRNYAIGKKRHALELGEKLTIGPYQVAVIQTLETLNLPEFLIGRWNIRVSLAYRGLLWVGGAQVDPGFRGRLSCPIYNLSTEPVELECGEGMAMIDFVTTTPFIAGTSKPFQWWDRKKLVFQQYRTDLCSGVENTLDSIRDEVKTDRLDLENNLKENSEGLLRNFTQTQIRIDTRIDTFLTLVFTVVAVLFAGLGIVATKGNDDPSFVSSPVWVAAVALYFALKPYAVAWSESKRRLNQNGASSAGKDEGRDWVRTLKPNFVEVFVAVIIVAGSIAFHISHAHFSSQTLRDQVKQTKELKEALNNQKNTFDTELRVLQSQTDGKLRNLEQQLEASRKK